MRVNYNPEISLGNLLQIAVLAGGIFAAYSALQQTDVRHDGELKAHTDAIVEIKKNQKEAVDELKAEVKDVKKGVDGINDRLTGVLIDNAKRNR